MLAASPARSPRLDDVGVERALDEEAGAAAGGARPEVAATSSKIRMNSSPMILRLRSGSVTPARAAKNRSAAFTWTRSMWNWRRKVSSTWSASPGPHEPGVDEDAGELVPDGLVDERRGHGRVDAARQGAQHPVAAHLGPHRRHLLTR